MQRLEHVHLVQFFLFEAQTLRFDPTTAIIAPNGAGKSALLDALQIVLLGGDRSRIRFNAQAGGQHRARTIRDYCLGTWRSGEDGRRRRTATTFISLVFRDEASGRPLTAGIALGASADEPEHRLHGLYLLPGVALSLEDHLERRADADVPLAWATFRELGARACREAGTTASFPTGSERFLGEMLHLLRAAPVGTHDVVAYRKAFLNALNLQRVEDVDLFVRTQVAEDRPTDIARFRSVLDSFRGIKERIEQVVRRIAAADAVAQHYARIADQATRAASWRALGAEYLRDLLADQVDAAQEAARAADVRAGELARQLDARRSEREDARTQADEAKRRLHGGDGDGQLAALDALAAQDRDALAQSTRGVLRRLDEARQALGGVAALDLPGVDAARIGALRAPWDRHYEALAARPPASPLPWPADAAQATLADAATALAPVVAQVDAEARSRQDALERLEQRLRVLRAQQARAAAGQAELRDDVARLRQLLLDAGIEATPVCDLVKITDPGWQPAIEAYLRSHVDALLVPAEQEQDAVRLYRGLQGGRAVYGVKLALASHARADEARPEAGSVAALIDGAPAAVAYLRRQLGRMACADTEGELVRSRQGLSRDGLVAKGGGIERLRLPGPAELRIGTGDQRVRLRQWREEFDALEAERRALEPLAQRALKLRQALLPWADPAAASAALDELLSGHERLARRLEARERERRASASPDLLRLGEEARQRQAEAAALDAAVEALSGELAVARSAAGTARAQGEALALQFDRAARDASEAFRQPDVDPARVERQRATLEEQEPRLEARRARCDQRAQAAAHELQKLMPEAWGQLAQYARDHGLALDFAGDDWRPARALFERELARLRDTELANYQAEAERAYATAVETFRSNVVSALADNFARLRQQIGTLNRTLRRSPAFSNNERYQFHVEIDPACRALHAFIQRATEIGPEDTLFGHAGEVPEAFRRILEDGLDPRTAAASPLDDYRRFFHFEVRILQDERVIGTLSERMRSGSGGEHRAPLYVIAGAALAAAYGKSEAHPGGLGLILLDEFGDKIDAQNARAITGYLRSLGLQLVLAAPDTAQGTLSGVLDSYLELFRDNDLLLVERVEVSEGARALLASDQFDLHPALLAEETARVLAARGGDGAAG